MPKEGEAVQARMKSSRQAQFAADITPLPLCEKSFCLVWYNRLGTQERCALPAAAKRVRNLESWPPAFLVGFSGFFSKNSDSGNFPPKGATRPRPVTA